jgi:hypothetical protein
MPNALDDHRVVQRTFAAAGFEARILHPFVTKQYRQPVDPGNKTDDTPRSASPTRSPTPRLSAR